MGDEVTIEVVIATEGETDLAVASLLRELREAGIDARAGIVEELPEHAKSGAAQVASLAIELVTGLAPAVASVLVAWRAHRATACQLSVNLPSGQRLEMPLGEAEARRLLEAAAAGGS